MPSTNFSVEEGNFAEMNLDENADIAGASIHQHDMRDDCPVSLATGVIKPYLARSKFCCQG